MSFDKILTQYRKIAFSERDKGNRFERLMQAFLQTDPKYAYLFKTVWLWNEFPGKTHLGGTDTGIDIVALTFDGAYWAIQCKCFQENAVIDKPAVDSFLSTSGRNFKDAGAQTIHFSQRLWISTTNNWGPNATEAIKNQHPPVSRINLYDLQQAQVNWERLDNGISGEKARTASREIKPHQQEALDKTNAHFKLNDRGKLIMACGTGKTFNALRIAEKQTGGKGLILFLVPSIALMSQTLREWTTYAIEPINAICICSDPEVSRKKTKNDDSDSFSVVDLALPASTNVAEIISQFKKINAQPKAGLTVVFSTYQSIERIAEAQKELQTTDADSHVFDLIICDEAHRTTGVSLAGEDESVFTKVHDDKFIQGSKRLYMTATPRLYSDDTKSKAAQAEAVLCSMDDVSMYGEEIYRIGFGEAVAKDLLTDYKVLILTLSDKDVPPAVQKMIADKDWEINADDASKLIGCINALSKQILGDEGIIKKSDPNPMKRAVAFCQSIAVSKKITEIFNTATGTYTNSLPADKQNQMVSVGAEHIDGTMGAPERDALLGWLKADTDYNECRVLTNVRCLSEGVDVPSLDAVMFLSARNSQVDVVQSVGRVMRKSPGKNYGYIIIPVVVPSDVEADKAMDDNERYKVVWSVLNALRAHDDRFNATINKIELNKNRPQQILVGRPEHSFGDDGQAYAVNEDQPAYGNAKNISEQLALQFEQLQHIVFARMVQKVGDRKYWEQWAGSVAQIAEKQTERINRLINDNPVHKKAFDNFLNGLKKNINDSIEQQEAVEMLSQHIITKPVFEALFENYSFVKNNPISVSMQSMLYILEAEAIEKDTAPLDKFYEAVKLKASGIDNAAAKQRIIIELYDKFFKAAFPKMVERLGIVYTPVEVVDFIIHSVNDVLKKEFDRSIGDENIHILDPFTGTGTFITRLLQSGLIESKNLERKYKHEIHANEIVLLAYYIAAVNIENAYHDAVLLSLKDTKPGKDFSYQSFDGICLTDTFQLGETENGEKLFKDMFPQNSERVEKQKKAPLTVIMGNPPYSIGQRSANDNAQNQAYPKLDSRIAATYAKLSSAGLNKSLYDAYIKSFRWSTDRLDATGGIICFVTNSGWLDSNSTDGFRKAIETEFTSIYVFNLRGSIRGRSGVAAKKEGQNVFDIMTGVAITLLVKNPNIKKEKADIYYHNIGDFLSRKEKITLLSQFNSFGGATMRFETIRPNEHGDWVSLRNASFDNFIPLAPEKKFDTGSKTFFNTYAIGIATNRDAWVNNYSQDLVLKNMKRFIDFYNEQRASYIAARNKNPKAEIGDFTEADPTRISWTRALRKEFSNNTAHTFKENIMVNCLYRPFSRQKLYYDKAFIESPGVNLKLFPGNDCKNVVITMPGLGERRGFATLISATVADINLYDGGTQCFPLYYYEESRQQNPGLFDETGKSDYIRRDGISDFILETAHRQYGKTIVKEDIFYYVYGFLHSPEYRVTFANDLKKMLPRLPLVEDVKDFWQFSKAGRALAGLHVNYETVPACKDVRITGADSEFFIVEKMRFLKKDQKDTIIYNSKITIENIPAKAYDYVVNGKTAIEWIMERYQVTTHKESGITNNPNDWAAEINNPRYILDLLLSIINVSVQTVDIVEALPKPNFG